MDKEILNKLIKNGAVNRIYNQNLKMVEAAKHKAFINSLEMLIKDAKALEGGNNANKSWSNPFAPHTNAAGISKNNYSNSNNWGQSASRSANSSSAQIHYIKYLIYLLSKNYSSSSYGQIYDEICKKQNLSAINTKTVSKGVAYHIIKSLRSIIPTTKPATSAGLSF